MINIMFHISLKINIKQKDGNFMEIVINFNILDHNYHL